jgi:type 1 fimbria pilin
MIRPALQTTAATMLVLACIPSWGACPPPTQFATRGDTIFIPRDAPLGSQISSGVVNYDNTRKHTCANRPVVLQMLAGPRVPPMTVANEGTSSIADIGAHLFQTNIAGISIGAVMTDAWLCRSAGGELIPRFQRYFPLSAVSCAGNTYQTRVYYWMYKTGPIEPGSHVLNQQVLSVLFDGAAQSSLTLNMNAVVAGCSMPSAADNQINVSMLPTVVRDFSGPGTAGPAQPFSISMHSCVRGTYSGYWPWNYFQGNYANVRFEPSRGSSSVDAQQGIVGLRPGSTARNIGVQILKEDSSPMKLGDEVQIKHVEDGITLLPFHARYIQTSDDPVEGGSADATVNFTITFR